MSTNAILIIVGAVLLALAAGATGATGVHAALRPAPWDPAATVVDMQESQVLDREQTFNAMYELAFGKIARQPAPQRELRLIAENADEVIDKLATDPKYIMRRPMMLPQPKPSRDEAGAPGTRVR